MSDQTNEETNGAANATMESENEEPEAKEDEERNVAAGALETPLRSTRSRARASPAVNTLNLELADGGKEFKAWKKSGNKKDFKLKEEMDSEQFQKFVDNAMDDPESIKAIVEEDPDEWLKNAFVRATTSSGKVHVVDRAKRAIALEQRQRETTYDKNIFKDSICVPIPRAVALPYTDHDDDDDDLAIIDRLHIHPVDISDRWCYGWRCNSKNKSCRCCCAAHYLYSPQRAADEAITGQRGLDMGVPESVIARSSCFNKLLCGICPASCYVCGVRDNLAVAAIRTRSLSWHLRVRYAEAALRWRRDAAQRVFGSLILYLLGLLLIFSNPFWGMITGLETSVVQLFSPFILFAASTLEVIASVTLSTSVLSMDRYRKLNEVIKTLQRTDDEVTDDLFKDQVEIIENILSDENIDWLRILTLLSNTIIQIVDGAQHARARHPLAPAPQRQ